MSMMRSGGVTELALVPAAIRNSVFRAESLRELEVELESAGRAGRRGHRDAPQCVDDHPRSRYRHDRSHEQREVNGLKHRGLPACLRAG